MPFFISTTESAISLASLGDGVPERLGARYGLVVEEIDADAGEALPGRDLPPWYDVVGQQFAAALDHGGGGGAAAKLVLEMKVAEVLDGAAVDLADDVAFADTGQCGR